MNIHNIDDIVPIQDQYWMIKSNDQDGLVIVKSGIILFSNLERAEIWLINQGKTDGYTPVGVDRTRLLSGIKSHPITYCDGRFYYTLEDYGLE